MTKKQDKLHRRLVKLANAVKGFTGAIGASVIVADHKWIGLAILALGALSNEVISYFKTENQSDK